MQPWYKPCLQYPPVFQTTTPDGPIGLPDGSEEKLKAFLNNRGVDGLGDFDKCEFSLCFI